MVGYGLLGFGCTTRMVGYGYLYWFLGFMKACNDDGGGWLWVCGDGE